MRGATLTVLLGLLLISYCNGLIVMTQFSSPSGALKCDAKSMLTTQFEFNSKQLCGAPVSSVQQYLFESISSLSVRIITFGPNDVFCNQTVLHSQTQKVGDCFKLAGDNPSSYWRLDEAETPCKSSECGQGQTCCYTPQLPGHGCVDGEDACCCPDFQNACAKGSTCLCEGFCPGPFCQCIQCIPAEFGLCTNKAIPAPVVTPTEVITKHKPKYVTPETFQPSVDVEPQPDIDVVCHECVDFFAENMNTILNLILQIGVEGTCQDICQKLPGSFAPVICDLLCIGVGLDEFIHILSSDDLDPVWICVKFDACPKNDCDGNCTELVGARVLPGSAELRSTFKIEFTIKGLKDSGTGTTYIQFPCVSNQCKSPFFSYAVINEGFKKGAVKTESISVHTDEDDWLYRDANYPVSITNCKYDCGDEHSTVFSTSYTNFTITQRH